MLKKVFERTKEFVEDNNVEVGFFVLGASATLIGECVGYKMGQRITILKTQHGLDVVFKDNPGLEEAVNAGLAVTKSKLGR